MSERQAEFFFRAFREELWLIALRARQSRQLSAAAVERARIQASRARWRCAVIRRKLTGPRRLSLVLPHKAILLDLQTGPDRRTRHRF